jgi:hypothetical protein
MNVRLSYVRSEQNPSTKFGCLLKGGQNYSPSAVIQVVGRLAHSLPFGLPQARIEWHRRRQRNVAVAVYGASFVAMENGPVASKRDQVRERHGSRWSRTVAPRRTLQCEADRSLTLAARISSLHFRSLLRPAIAPRIQESHLADRIAAHRAEAVALHRITDREQGVGLDLRGQVEYRLDLIFQVCDAGS